jgi:hypothetical protein
LYHIPGRAWLFAARRPALFGREDAPMKRDMDLIRKILLQIEKDSTGLDQLYIKLDGYPDQDVQFHIMLLVEADLIIAIDGSGGDALRFVPIRLTWAGYEFLDAARDDTRWNKAKDAMNKAGGFVFEVAKSLLIDYMKQQLIAQKP